MGAYVFISAATLLAWDIRGFYGATGDEPHYLVISDALVSDHSPDVTAAYYREFENPRWYPLGLGNPTEALTPPSAHVVGTDGRNFSWHGVGMSVLTAVPVWLVGEMGARLVAIAIGACGVLVSWVLAGVFTPSRRAQTWAVASVALSYPILLASTQIYPDLLGGILLVAVLTWWVHPGWRSSGRWTLTVAAAAAFIPWLGSRFWIAGALAVLALVAGTRGLRKRMWSVIAVAFLSAVALAGYHVYAFDSIVGPPSEGALAWGSAAIMVAFGLVLDQNQGLLFSNPVLWIAIPGVVLLWRQNRSACVLWLVLFFSVLIPAAGHPGLYGLGSFNGRYGWPLSIMAMLPALVFLGFLAGTRRRLFAIAVGLGIAFQMYLVGLALFVGGSGPGSPLGLDLYTKSSDTWLESYSAWWYPIQEFLPAWYSTQWAFAFAPNWVWLGFAAASVLLFAYRPRSWPFLVALLIPAVLATGMWSQPGPREMIQTSAVSLTAGDDGEGFPVVGPTRAMRQGPYTWWVTYTASGSGVVGKWELVRVLDDTVVAAGELRGTDSRIGSEMVTLPYASIQPREFVFRIGWYATESMTVTQTGVKHGESTRG